MKKKITEILSTFSTKNVLTSQEMSNLKGGVSTNTGLDTDSTSTETTAVVKGTVTGVVKDDKRRERPGGGITTL